MHIYCSFFLATMFTYVTSSPASQPRVIIQRDAYNFVIGGNNSEGENHKPIVAPFGSKFKSILVGQQGETVAAFWSEYPQNDTATHAFIMIHGKLRNGKTYWKTMEDVLKLAVQEEVTGAHNNSIVVAPQLFSTVYNSGQYSSDQLAWGDTNAWQTNDVATHPAGTNSTSFDALDALVDEFANATRYPLMKNVTVVGHGGGGQMVQRYAMAAKDSPSNIHVRYIHGDPSTCAYFTDHRPLSISNGTVIPSKDNCTYYDWWRYGFKNFTGTAEGLKTPQQYFQQYITRDVISLVGYEDTAVDGDTTCMGNIQGGTKRRDRNLAWWQYVNTLARTREDLVGFPATFGKLPDWSAISGNSIDLQLVVIKHADHNATEVFESKDGMATLFSGDRMPEGWRPGN